MLVLILLTDIDPHLLQEESKTCPRDSRVEGNAVFTYLDAFSCDQDFADFWPEYQNLDELKEHYTRGGLGDMKCKKFLNEVLNKFLEPMRQRRAELEKDIPEICNILKKGTEQAREVGAQTMDEVRRAMRIDYFNDATMWQSPQV